ncbi:transporter substrate-binding domain-containing protein [Hydrogenophaga sp.]|uniref:transporter substrate-binding domain-containing protein n=1 Tax=Hydrogenophaga sp. TaxID=1904254 RepID=UPI00286DC401|nr:transporter substrate-binding domain-containing protein [Hydrogenophaga sp.]
MKPHKHLLHAALLFIAVLTGLSLWLVHISVPPSVSSQLQHGGGLRVGFAVEVPYAYVDAQGKVTGEAPEIFRLMAQRLGIERIDWVRMDFASLLPELQLGRIDAIAAGMFITSERQRLAAFTRPTASVRAAVIVRQGEQQVPLRPVTADLERASAMLWVTVHEAVENDLLIQAGVLPGRITTVPRADRGLRSVAEGHADALAISAVTAWHLVSTHPQWPLEVRTLSDAPAGFPAFVFRHDDRALRDAMDQALQTYLGSEEHRALVRGFGFTSEEMPPDLP